VVVGILLLANRAVQEKPEAVEGEEVAKVAEA